MYNKLTFLSLVLLACSAFMPSAQAQPRRSNSIVWDEPNPAAVRNAVLSIALYSDRTVTVAFGEHKLLAGEIDEVRAEDFTLKTQFSQQSVGIPFADVHSFRWVEPKHTGNPYAIKATAERLSQEPPATARVRLRNRQTLQGQIRGAGELDFTLVVQDSGETKILRYRDVDKLSDPQASSPSEPSQILGYIALTAAGIVMLPLMLLAMLSGWDGC